MFDITKIPNYSEKIEFLKSTIKSIPDYPKPGIMFRDITSLCENGQAFAITIDLLYAIYKDAQIDKVVAAEARGFVFGAALASKLKAGFVMVRKPGKLPRHTIEESYELEYGVNKLQIHEDSLKRNERVTSLFLRCHRGTMEFSVSHSVMSSYSGLSSGLPSFRREWVVSIRMGKRI